MPRLITLRCSNETAKKIETALAVRSSGLFPIVTPDAETTVEAAQVEAILTEWVGNLTMQAVQRANERFTGIAANLEVTRPTREVHHLETVCLPPMACETPDPAPKRKPKAEAGE